MAVEQQVALVQFHAHVADPFEHPRGLQQVRAEALQHGLLFRCGIGGIGAGQQRQIDARAGLFVELHAGHVAHPVGEVEILIVRVAQDVLLPVVLEVVVPVAHGAIEHEAAAWVEVAEFAVVGLDGRGLAEVDLGRLRAVIALVPEQQGAELAAGGAGQAFQQWQPGVFVEYAFIAESDQAIVLGLEIPLSHVSLPLYCTGLPMRCGAIYGTWPLSLQGRPPGLSDGWQEGMHANCCCVCTTRMTSWWRRGSSYRPPSVSA
ncbi:hypothetical protein D3C76_1077860 [compost metagenome]